MRVLSLPSILRRRNAGAALHRVTAAALVLLLGAGGVAGVSTVARAEAAERIALRQGVLCRAVSAPEMPGETHVCYFAPTKVGRHDFSTRNGRAGHVASELGPSCGEIEILGETEVAQDDGASLRRVSVLCLK